MIQHVSVFRQNELVKMTPVMLNVYYLLNIAIVHNTYFTQIC